MQTPLLTRDEMERRRLAAAQDLLNGVPQARVARKFGVSRTTASRWGRALDNDGMECLRKRRATGRPSRLTVEQRTEIVEMFTAGPRAAGLDSERWTTARLAEAIYNRFGVRYDPDHVGRLMHRLGLRKKQRGTLEAPVQFQPAPAMAVAYVASRYSPNTALSLSEISPTVQ
jgi:transposase